MPGANQHFGDEYGRGTAECSVGDPRGRPVTEIHVTDTGVEFVRTPDERFHDLVDFAYVPSDVDIDGLRMAYIDEGPRERTRRAPAAR